MAVKRMVVGEGVDLEAQGLVEAPDMGDLEVLSGASQEWKWHVYRRKSQDEVQRNPRGQAEVYVTTLHGAVDLPDFHQRFGGGDYVFKGYVTGLRGCQESIRTELEGPHRPPKIGAEDPAPTAAAAAAPMLNGDARVVRYLRKMTRRLETLEQRPTAPVAAPVDPMVQMATTIGIIKTVMEMVPHPAAAPPPTPVKDVMEMINVGMNLRDTAGGSAVERTPGEIILEKALPAVERLATAILTRRPGPPPPRPAPVETRAEVVTEPPPAAAAPPPPPAPAPTVEPDMDAETRARWSTLVGSLARAITDRREPADFAATAEDILAPDEIEILKLGSADELVSELSGAAGGRYPILLTEQAKEYVAAVLAELNSTA